MAETPQVVVVGSINMDLVMRVPYMPRAGETLLGKDLQTIPGGKGANQAVGVARLGTPCAIVGRVGDDDFGNRLLVGLRTAHVNTRHVTVAEGVASGVAMITVDQLGENAICVASGANARVTPADIDTAASSLHGAKICLMQLELPMETVLHAIRLCQAKGVATILDCAPAPREAPAEMFRVDVLTANLGEAEALTRERATTRHEAKALAAALAARGARQVVLKMGEHGAVLFDGDRFEHVAGHRITPIDTTAAGDAFTAALAVGLARGEPLREAVRFANAAGAAACTKFGAQPSLPTISEVMTYLDGR